NPDRIPIAITGYLDTAATLGDNVDTASWRIISSPADCEAAEEAIIPCTTSRPDLAHRLLTECEPSDLLQVTGHLTLPTTGRIRLEAHSVEVLWEAPLQEPTPRGRPTITPTGTGRSTRWPTPSPASPTPPTQASSRTPASTSGRSAHTA
ncbi:hypothetical protein ACWD74_40135, partial [Streptomyces fagopyri]